MADIGLISRIAIAGVLLFAALGKLLLVGEWSEILLGVAEAGLGVLLFLPLATTLSGVAALGLTLAYLAYALQQPKDSACHCFGQRLPTTSRAAQIARNSCLVGLALVALASAATTKHFDVSLLDVALGTIIAADLVGLPWVTTWAYRRIA